MFLPQQPALEQREAQHDREENDGQGRPRGEATTVEDLRGASSAPPPPAEPEVQVAEAPPRPAPPPTALPVAATPPPAAAGETSTYTVKEGDVLSEIASRLLGSSRKYLVIYEHNRDILESPDALRAGMTLKIPRDAG